MDSNPLYRVQQFGQSIWLDYIRRGLLESGELKRMLEEDGVRGVTVNPSILEKAIAGSHDYDDAIRTLSLEGFSAKDIYEKLAVEDVRRAADLFLELYQHSDGHHGFVSLEVSPYLAHDTEGTVEEARRFWKELDRPNVMIKVPATHEGLAAIEQLITEGINVNVTLLFGLPRYRQVIEAFIKGLEARMVEGKPLYHIQSVASFFLSRIDVLIDPRLEQIEQQKRANAQLAVQLHGQVAIASARAAYQIYKDAFHSDRFQRLKDEGARSQRLLWASTSTKNPAYSDIMYVEALIGDDTVNTLPLETLNAYRDHGQPASRIEDNIEEARFVLQELHSLDIDLDQATQQLEDEGVEKFSRAYDQLIEALENARTKALQEPVDVQQMNLGNFSAAVGIRLANLQENRFGPRLWRKDASLWKENPSVQAQIRNALGWLHVCEKMEENLDSLKGLLANARGQGMTHVVHLGMGGSSLAPLVFQRMFATGSDGLNLFVLDTSDPVSIRSIERQVPLEKTLFIVASKSGMTAETRALGDYFYELLKKLVGDRAGEHFIAITDPGTPLVKVAKERGFRRIFLNFPDIGGRYSALSFFGLVPAALMGLDVSTLLSRALRMVHACATCVPVEENPGLTLGAALGELGLAGWDKVTFLTPPDLAPLGMWLEQLLAESTGKEGAGLLPVAGEIPGSVEVYGNDRLFINFHLETNPDEGLQKKVKKLQQAGFPVISLGLNDRFDIAQEFFRWEIAVAVAGSVLGINPFDQPNVQESKDNTNELLEDVREQGSLPQEEPTRTEGLITLFDGKHASSMTGALVDFIDSSRAGDYISLMAYLPESSETDRILQKLQMDVRNATHLATTLGYGPRFLHSTGQFHKGGPNTGLFIQFTCASLTGVTVPGQDYDFATFQRAQALGDLHALRRHQRRVIRLHLAGGLSKSLEELQNLLSAALNQLAAQRNEQEAIS